MKKSIETSHVLDASVENLWKNISKADGVDVWLPVITACRLEGSGEGAKRICSTEKGDLNETIVKIDNDNKVFQYAIDEQPLLPIDNILGTMSVKNSGGKTILGWDVEFDILDEAQFPMVKEAMEGMYAAGAKGLEAISQ